MTPEDPELRRALDARSGVPSPEYRARLSTVLGAGRPAARTTPAIALVAAACLAIAMVGVLLLSRLGPQATYGPGPASAARSQATPSPAAEAVIGSVAMFGDSGWAVAVDSGGRITDLLRTGDGGRTWRAVTPHGVQGSFIFGAEPIDARRAWLMAAGPSQEGTGPVDLWATNDGGQTWSKTTAPGFVFRGALITFTDGTHGWLAVPGEPLSQEQQQGIVIDRTVDGGKTWQRVAETSWPPAKSTRGAPPLNCGKSDLSFLDATTGWLTGGCTAGITFDMTADGGVTWSAQPLTAPGGVKFSAACGGGPCTLSAPRFVPQPVGSDQGLFASLGYMVLHDTGAYPGRSWLYTSNDHGRSWTIHRLPGPEATVAMVTSSVGFASVLAIDSAGVFVPAAPWLYRTDDGGRSWQPVAANVQLSYATLDCVSASRCWALSSSQTDSSTRLYETTDGGRTWSQLTGPTTPPTPPPSPTPALTPGVIAKPPGPIVLPASVQLSAPSTDVVWALVANEYLYRSTDRGATWQQEPLLPSKAFCPAHASPCPYPPPTEISFVSDREGWFMTGDSGQAQCSAEAVTVWHTADAGATWQWLGSKGIPLSQCKAGLSFADSNRGFLSAWNPTHGAVIYRTMDGGRTWRASQPLTLPFKTVCVDCIATQAGSVRAFGSTLLVLVRQQAGSTDHYVLGSTDGGVTWAYLASRPTNGGFAIVTASRWLQVILPGQSVETTDAGKSWNPYSSDYTQAAGVAPDVVFADPLVGYATVRGGISRTVDGGQHWTAIETPGTGMTTTG
jgi:photosystem II stability/assembly factor-like uncharacterized protein